MDPKLRSKARLEGHRLYLETLPEEMQAPMAEYLLTGTWPIKSPSNEGSGAEEENVDP